MNILNQRISALQIATIMRVNTAILAVLRYNISDTVRPHKTTSFAYFFNL